MKNNWIDFEAWKTLEEWQIKMHIIVIEEYFKDKIINKENKDMKNKPKQDGTGQGTRANKGRGGCAKPRKQGQGRISRIRQRWNQLFNK